MFHLGYHGAHHQDHCINNQPKIISTFYDFSFGLEWGIQIGNYLNKFLSDIDILTSPLTEVTKKILITSCNTFNIAINSTCICYDTTVKKLIQYFLS